MITHVGKSELRATHLKPKLSRTDLGGAVALPGESEDEVLHVLSRVESAKPLHNKICRGGTER